MRRYSVATPETIGYRGDLPAPVSTYAAVTRNTPAEQAVYSPPPSTMWTRSAVVQRRAMRTGLRYFYAHGGTQMPLHVPYPGGADGSVHRSKYQTTLVKLVDWSQNVAWFQAGCPRNLGLSFRTPQIKTQRTGGPGPGIIAPRPLFTRVQRVQRPTTAPQTYNTTSAKG